MAMPRSQRLPRTDSWLDWTEGYRQHRYESLEARSNPCRKASSVGTAWFILFGVALGWLCVLVQQPLTKREHQQTRSAWAKPLSAQSTMDPGGIAAGRVNVWNSYSAEETIRLDRMYPFEVLAEPYRKSLLVLDLQQQDGLEATVRWTVDGVEVGTGTSVGTVFKGPGVYPCTVTVSYTLSPTSDEPDGGGASHSSGNSWWSSRAFPPNTPDPVTHDFDVTVKYVRREIRELTDRDRETFFNAVSVLQRVPSAVGRKVYGNRYYSKDYFNRLHLHYGGQKDCDHWHDGAGFVTSHIAISLMYEQALQSVNPSIALPYWDFTIEGMAFDWTNFRTSEVFSDDWFGNAAPRNKLMTPDRGRFAYVPVMANATEYSVIHNPYGLLRSPWNTYNEPFLTRHDHLFGYTNNRKPSGCKQYRDAAMTDTWMLLTEAMNAGAHGHIHELLGGAWSAEWHGFYNRTEEIVLPITHIIVPLMKFLWRANYLHCPESCDMSVGWNDCQCFLNEEAVTGMTPSEILGASGVLSETAGAFFYDQDLKLIDSLADEEGKPHAQIPGYSVDETKGVYTEMLRLLITPTRIGTHYEGASTNDVTFWVLHPTFDRLWHLSRLEAAGSDTFDETWRDDHSCYGHNPEDIQPFFNLFLDEPSATGSSGGGGGEGVESGSLGGSHGGEEVPGSRGMSGVDPPKHYYTNRMLYDLLKPDGLSSPYVYNHFQWPHCDALGIHLRGHISGGDK